MEYLLNREYNKKCVLISGGVVASYYILPPDRWYVATFLAAASSLGVATCAQAALALYSDGVREHLGIGEDRLIVCGIAFGYADPEHPANTFRADRADLTDVVRRHG